ncbi:GNAT family N-acetyltransferase [Nocardiopsis sp. HNM0947]|uniref:GNAT family N-acetyltransferase n=1 Tax=Nocardiopsis coralli TaxID=2772213 RepID=A0ABR9P8J4_9ACTN|nr:GNAT family N-acetyltransferase [Nocardiopsis coralli]MBE3000162.1 GNAT family N-acetyltransferase [Nocardiopsis coralli]
MIELRPWNHPEDTVRLQDLAERLWPLARHPGGIGWEAATRQRRNHTRLAEREGTLVAWAEIEDSEIEIYGASHDPEAGEALLAWALEIIEPTEPAMPDPTAPEGQSDSARTEPTRLRVGHGDDVLASLARQAGFAPDPTGFPWHGLFRSAEHAEAPAWPEGYRVRSVRDDEAEARVQVHRAAWHPPSIPYPPERAARVSPDAQSRFCMEFYEDMRRNPMYDPALDLLVEAPDGSLAAHCTIWWSPALGVAEVEPLGVLPEHRRRGLGGTLALEACARVRDLGGHEVFINGEYVEIYPLPTQVYRSVGYRQVELSALWARARSRS